jgi:hypothetical protein
VATFSKIVRSAPFSIILLRRYVGRMNSETPAPRVTLLVVCLLLLSIHSSFVFLGGGKIIEGEEIARWPLGDLFFCGIDGFSLFYHD